jgi:signal peptidase I
VWRELPVLLVVAGLIALLVRSFVFQAFRIPSGSMENTLQIGDRVLVNKVVYDFRGIQRGDIVVFNGQGSWDPSGPAASTDPAVRFFHDVLRAIGIETDGTDYIKRVIGVPGDHVVCCGADGRITVNGVPISESSYLYPGNSPSDKQFNVTVPPGRLWVMGDHRGDSEDSRYHSTSPGGGAIPENEVVGRSFVVIWPPSRVESLPIPGTFKQAALSAAARAEGGAASAVPLATGVAATLPVAWLRLGRRRGGRPRRRWLPWHGGRKGYRARYREW